MSPQVPVGHATGLNADVLLAMDWSDFIQPQWPLNDIRLLISLWMGGMTTTDIAARMKRTKHAVVKKKARMRLPSRPSPIKRAKPNPAKPPPVQIIRGPRTLPLLASSLQDEFEAGVVVQVEPGPHLEPRPDREPVSAALVCKYRPCCWPIQQDGRRRHRSCDAQSALGKPYCPEHCAIAYVPKIDRKQAAASSAVATATWRW